MEVSLDKRPAKAHLELLVAASNKLRNFVVHKFRGFPKNAKIELLETTKATIHHSEHKT